MDATFTPSFLKRIIYLIVVACLTQLIYQYLHHDQRFWLVWIAFTFSLILKGEIFLERLTILCIAGLIATIAASISAAITFITPLLILYLFILTIGCVYASQQYPRYFFPLFLINLFAILSAIMPIPLSQIQARACFMLVGVGIALVPQLICWPYFLRHEWQSYIKLVITNLIRLNRELFSCFLEPGYVDNIYLYERRLHIAKNNWMMSIAKLRECVNPLPMNDERKQLESLLTQLDLLYDILLDCGQIRRRVTDYTIFAVCTQELKAISNAIDEALTTIIAIFSRKKHKAKAINLAKKVMRLEETNQHVLQVAAREPLAFYLFIASLKSLDDKLNELTAIEETEKMRLI